MDIQNTSINRNDTLKKRRKRTPANASRSAHGVQLHGLPPKALESHLATTLSIRTRSARRNAANNLPGASPAKSSGNSEPGKPSPKPRRVRFMDNMFGGMKKVDAGTTIRQLMVSTSPHQLRERLGEPCLPNIFDLARQGKFGAIGTLGRQQDKIIRKMFHRMARDTRDGMDTDANAEYFLQIIEEMPADGLEVPFLAGEMFKLLVVLVSYRKPPPPAAKDESVQWVMTRQQILSIVAKEFRDAIRADESIGFEEGSEGGGFVYDTHEWFIGKVGQVDR
ncbi:hypothetical protein GTA08_BOTSDO12812 [Neofusicoccum parvum]|nr:hypothetical protein GTA08_BOTSDO12812 [Neofusicoccum parvum]